jgi:hypothetical protein
MDVSLVDFRLPTGNRPTAICMSKYTPHFKDQKVLEETSHMQALLNDANGSTSSVWKRYKVLYTRKSNSIMAVAQAAECFLSSFLCYWHAEARSRTKISV